MSFLGITERTRNAHGLQRGGKNAPSLVAFGQRHHVSHNQSIRASQHQNRQQGLFHAQTCQSFYFLFQPALNLNLAFSKPSWFHTLSKGNLNITPELSERKLWSHCRALINNHSLFTLTTLKLRLGETLFLPTAGCPDQPPFSQSRCKLTAPSNDMLRRCS